MTNRIKTPSAIESDVLEKCGRRCCVCYALQRNFNVTKGQVAHLDHNSANYKFDNLCFLCIDHHDDYDSSHRQTKGLSLNEVKRYRDDLYKTIAEWKKSKEAVSNLPVISRVPLLSFFEEASSLVKTSSKGIKILEREAGFRVVDKKHHPSLTLDIQFKEIMFGFHDSRALHLTISMPFGLTIQAEVCAFENWSITGFMNVLHDNLDIWILYGRPLQNDERHPIQQPRDSLFVYRTIDGENRIIISTHTLSEAPIQFHARISDKVGEGLANYLDEVGFSKTLKEL